MENSLGGTVAKEDNTIKEALKKMIDLEDNIITQYQKLKEIEPTCNESLRTDFEKILEEHRLFLEYKLVAKEKQNDALLVLLDYLNTLDKKEKKMHINETLVKMESLENEISIFNDLLRK